ncbi:probable G-protein coupled receptor 141 isoform X2 [Camelus dromedarius]|uniref:probable G-protein coupled receptor 141 isoform X2 n=1 Tax=Camelus dromedarius TaxID=9838 RepID=UPI003119E592
MQPVPVLFKAEIKHFNSKSSCQERKDNCWKVAGETPQIPTLALLEEAKAVAMHSLQIGKGVTCDWQICSHQKLLKTSFLSSKLIQLMSSVLVSSVVFAADFLPTTQHGVLVSIVDTLLLFLNNSCEFP